MISINLHPSVKTFSDSQYQDKTHGIHDPPSVLPKNNLSSHTFDPSPVETFCSNLCALLLCFPPLDLQVPFSLDSCGHFLNPQDLGQYLSR